MLDPSLAGRVLPPTPVHQVARPAVAAFAAAIGEPLAPGTDEAPPTYPIVVAFEAMRALLADPDVGIELRDVVHADQRFEITRPVRVGDVLTARLEVTSVRHVAGNDLVATRSEVLDADGDHVCTAYATLAHRGGQR